MDSPNPGDVWKLRDYLIEKIEEKGKRVHPFSVLVDPSVNKWFSYTKTW